MKRTHRQWGPGFTLIELILVAAIIGVLASIAIPKFADLIVKAQEAAVKGKLGSVRSAASIYVADHDGVSPFIAVVGSHNLNTLVPKYIDQIPYITIPRVHSKPGNGADGLLPANLPACVTQWEFSGWAYFTNFSSGEVRIRCIHSDLAGRIWSTL